jgi:predicted MFS family arabinose efflux permease
MMTFCYLLCAPCLLVFLSGGGMAVISIAVVLFSFMRAVATANETPSMCELIDPRDRATAQSLMNMLNTIAGGTGVFIAGYLKADWGLSGVFAGVAVLVLIAAGLTWRARPKEV